MSPKAAAPKPYPKVDPQPDLPRLETRILESWDRDDTFRRSIEQRPAGEHGENEFVFYDGPPFANGLPHHGHLITGYIKDIIPRYQTLRGRRVERRFGWDCHGLPVEMLAEKELGVAGHAAIDWPRAALCRRVRSMLLLCTARVREDGSRPRADSRSVPRAGAKYEGRRGARSCCVAASAVGRREDATRGSEAFLVSR